jgi:hypothetical protein
MRSWAQPTADEISRVQALAGRPENRAYFFDRLENPLWVRALTEAGFFAGPPEPVPAGEPGFVRFPPWPEGRYLARVAPDEPEAVAGVLRSIGPSGNPAVTRIIIEALLALPQGLFEATAERLPMWLEGPFVEHFDDEAATAIARLLELGATSIALEAARRLLAVQPDPRLAEKASTDRALRLHPEASARMSDWHYERVLERITTALAERAGLEAVQFLSSLLEDALRLSTWDEEGTADGSQIWRPAVEDHAQNSDSGVRNALVSATRDAALRVASTGDSALADVVAELEPHSILHKRIALHVLATSDGGRDLLDERMGDHDLFDDYRVRHEYATLLRNRFHDATEQTKATVLSWIDAGPDVDDFRQRRLRFDGETPTAEDVDRYVRVWQRDWLSFIAEQLDSAHAAQYDALVTDIGEPEHPDFTSWSSSWSGPESPLSAQEIADRTIDEVLAYLRSWQPADDSGWHFGPSIEGLGRVLSEDVKARPNDYASAAASLSDLDPTYVRSILSGLDNALRDGATLAWQGPLTLAEFVVSQPFEPDEEVPDRDRDPGWRWCRREIASVLRSGFADRPNRIPFAERERAWSLVERLLEDPNPSPEHEQRYGGDNMDPFTLSINTNRGTAMHAVVEYALWLRRELEARGQDVSRGFAQMPEVAAALDAHVSPDDEPSLAVHAVFGRWLPWLLLLDESWVIERHTDLLPAEPLDAYRNVVWGTYISWCPPYDSAFRSLHGDYETAVASVPSGVSGGTFNRASVDAKLGQHLVTFYWRGIEDGSLIDAYFARADDELASEAMEFIGRSLHNTTGDVPGDIAARIEALWDRRLAAAQADPTAHLGEVRTFGMSFASGKLGLEWSLTRLEQAVQMAGAPKLGHWVVERLVDLVESSPSRVANLLADMLEHPENEWDHVGWREEARTIIEAAARSNEPAALEHARSIVDFYVRRGELDFRELLRTQ